MSRQGFPYTMDEHPAHFSPTMKRVPAKRAPFPVITTPCLTVGKRPVFHADDYDLNGRSDDTTEELPLRFVTPVAPDRRTPPASGARIVALFHCLDKRPEPQRVYGFV